MRSLQTLLLSIAALTVASCASFGPKEPAALAPQNQSVELAGVPPDIEICAGKQTKPPAAVKLTSQQLTAMLAAEKGLSDEKSRCLRRLICIHEGNERQLQPPDKRTPESLQCAKLLTAKT